MMEDQVGLGQLMLCFAETQAEIADSNDVLTLNSWHFIDSIS